MSKPGLILSYGFRDAAKSRVVLLLIVTSLSIAFATVLASASVLEGFKTILVNGAIGTYGDIMVVPKIGDDNIPNVDTAVQKINAIDNVEATTVRSDGTIALSYHGVSDATNMARGIIPADENRVTVFKDDIIHGSFLHTPPQKEVVIGLSLADALVEGTFDKKLAQVGDTIEVSAFGGKTEDFKIAGVTDAKGFMGNLMIFFNKKDLENIDPTFKNAEIGVKLKDPSKLEQTKQAIKNLDMPVQVFTWAEEAGYVNDIVSVVSFIMTTINHLLIFSVFVIISIIVFINVFQKRRQIGIMKSMGSTSAFIVSIYMFETIIYTILSYLIGLGIFGLIYLYSDNHPFPTLIGDFRLVFNQANIISTSIILFIAAVAGSFIPSYLAAKTRIIDVLNSSI